MDFPFLNTRLRYSCWATLFRYLPWLIHRSAVSSKSGPTMGVAATTHDHNRLSSVPYYRLSRLARLCPPPITRVSLSLSVWSCRVWWWWWWRWCLSSRRERGQRPRGVVSMIRIERELRGKLRHVSREGGGVSSSMKFKTSSEREAQTTPRNSCVPSLFREPVVQLHQTFRKIGKPFMRMCVCVFARNYGEKRFRFTSRVSDRRCGRKGW